MYKKWGKEISELAISDVTTVLTLRGKQSKFVSLNMFFNNPQVKYWAKNVDGSVQKQKINLNMQDSFSSQQEYKEKTRKVR